MKLIVPMARRVIKDSARFQPPSPLMGLAGRPILVRVLDVVKSLDISEVIFIVGRDSSDLKKIVSDNFNFKTRFVLQKNQKGVAHAIYGAKKFVGDESCIVLFADSIVSTNLKSLNKVKEDVIIWTKEVVDPRPFGVVFVHNGFVSRLIEKPDSPVSDLAMVGMYYFKNAKLLFDSISFLIKNNILNKGVYQLTDALQIMINKGARVIPRKVYSWYDCGTKKNLLEANKSLIFDQKSAALEKNNILIKPVFVEKGVHIKDSIIGPNVSVGADVKIINAIIKDSVIGDGAVVENENLESSFIGRRAKVVGSSKKINLRDLGVIKDD